VSAAPNTAIRDNAGKPQGLEADARALAETQRDLERTTRGVARSPAPSPVTLALERAQKHLAATHTGDTALPKAAEWFLDNYYLIRRVARQVDEELPRGFVRHLPQLTSGPSKRRPRIEALAGALVSGSRIELDVGAVRRFLDAYQEVSPLTIAELWALPTKLRASVLLHLLAFLDRLHVPIHGMDRLDGGRVEPVALDPGAGVERCTRALRLLDAIDWKTFFENTNRVEAILRDDPAGIYRRMDFATCDVYRKVVEALAWATGRTEQDVADLAITLARENPSDERLGHVGYYLTGSGRCTLEQRLGYRAVGIERVRRAVTRRPTLSYLLPLALLTLIPLLAIGGYLARNGAQPLSIAVAMIAAAVPVSGVAVAVLQRALARLLLPRTLPKLDFSRGIPADARTLVVIPTLLGRLEDVDGMIRQIELHYLANPDPQLGFALLTDDVDADSMPRTTTLLETAEAAISALNARHGKSGSGPFHLLHREPRWNAAEQRFMGWERKRGKLDELNRLLRGDTHTTFARHVGDPAGLVGIRFVITLDSDTQLPMGTAHRLVGLLAHPLNRALVDPETGRVVAGYTIVQPRIETSPSSSRSTWFSRIFAGDVGFDIYTHAVSELYQDLFGSGIYVGKGIYDVDAFMRSVDQRAPENALVSHDLFEGVHGRTALASDVVLFEDYPSSYAAYAKRMHRWIRGDWQLLPWLLPHVPSVRAGRLRNKLSGIDRWKIVDNLRRSLTSPLLVVLLVSGWLWLSPGARLWTPVALVVLLAPVLPALAGSRRMRLWNLGRCGLAIAFLVYEAIVVVDAIVRVIVRTVFTRKHLLQWTSAAHTALGLQARSPRAVFWRMMWPSPVVAVAIAVLIAWLHPSVLVVAAPFLASWFVAPEIARRVSEPVRVRIEALRGDDRKTLRLLARRTWRFFDVFVGPNDQWLPIDNYQAEPHEQTAHRTSPTNIGLMLLATLSAYDFGYIGPGELSLRVRRAFDSIARLPHYQGHLFNWYDTKNLQPLLPRYVSTVDSGNFAGCLLALAQGCREVATAHVVRAAAWDGLADSLDLLDEAVESAPAVSVGEIRSVIARMQRAARHGRDNPQDAHTTLRTLCDDTCAELDRELLAFLGTGAHRHEADLLRALRMTSDRLRQQLQSMRRELDTLLPWLAWKDEPAAAAIELPTDVRLDEVPRVAQRLRGELDSWARDRRDRAELSDELASSVQRLAESFHSAELAATALRSELLALATLAEQEVRGMDFRLVFDRDRKLFHIGYNATLDQIDPHYYDLLASEARLASYLAIVKRDVPESHWYALGRPMTNVDGAPALLSWGGTMFEYLMPSLLMRSREGSLLARTGELAVAAQIAAARPHEPWGVSESAYARLDAHQTYQYRTFGVPGLGFRRGLEEDRVIAPYASILAVALRPRAVVANLAKLASMGMLGTYGLFDALDLTVGRVPEGESFAVVRSYMAHHQGMIFVALGNAVTDRTMIERFHANAMIETGELLLNEHAPEVAPPEWPIVDGAELATTAELTGTPRAPGPWAPSDRVHPQAFVLGNGRLTSLVTESGGGGLRWQGLAVTRYEPDSTRDDDGTWIYLRDEDSGRVWLATSQDGRTTYAMHKAELHRRHEGISVHVEIAVAPADDVEIRHITLHNETDRLRRIAVTSAGRPVLFDARQTATHPVFSSLFVESERLAELDALVFARRPRSAKDLPAVLVHRLVHEAAAVTPAGYETDRAAFHGRRGDWHAPAALVASRGALRGHAGAVLDPIMSLMASVSLRPKRSVTLALVTTVGRSRHHAIALARRYGSMHAVRWAVRDAEQESPRRLQRTRLDPALLPTVQRLFSSLWFADPTLRVPSDLATPHPCKQRLWGRGISGDDPIVLVRVTDPEAPILGETLAAQRYLRSCGVSESSLGATWSLNSGENRLTPWSNDPVLDTPSEALYLRDEETAAVWSPTPLPAGGDRETLVRHGAGYTVYETDCHGLEQTLTVFVPPDAAIKVVRLRIKNTLPRHRRLTATYYAEWVLGSRRDEQRPYIVSEYERTHACLLATCSWNAEYGDRVAFLVSMAAAHGFTTDRTEFLGRRGDHARPEALERWGLSGRVDPGVDPCAALQIHLELAPGEQLETHFVLGEAASRDDALALAARFKDRGAIDAAWAGLHVFWDDALDTVRVKTPEPAMDILLNRWLLYQSLSSRMFGRTGFYQPGGAFGYRDQLQDVLALVHAAPERARAQILTAAAHQFEDGDVLHWWHPPGSRGVRTRCADDMAWLPYVTADYVAATGDVAILDEPVAFLAGDPLRLGEHERYAEYATSARAAPVLEHCRRALERAVTQGAHGIPLFGDGDWNDGMNRVGANGRGESVWLGWFLCATMNRFASLSESIHDSAAASTWRARADALRAAIERSAWDGEWYLRAFHDDGSLVGSAANRECRIDSIAQSWAVLSRRPGETVDPRARAAIRAADDLLVRDADRLVLLFSPPYDSTLHDPGYVRAYPPGIRENGGQYTHAATWLGWAHAVLGDGERAERIFRLLNPILRARTSPDVERYRVEPYALAADIYSCPPWVGRGGWTWYTGAAAWLWRLGVEAILGLRKEAGGLRIDPCLPPAWKGFEAWVRVGHQRVHVVVENPHGVASGVATMTLDGTPLASNQLSLDPDLAGTHEVHVQLGFDVITRASRTLQS
jgi:cyclic beta-1,2-glucan synthetase